MTCDIQNIQANHVNMNVIDTVSPISYHVSPLIIRLNKIKKLISSYIHRFK